jgi:hypothetical protein
MTTAIDEMVFSSGAHEDAEEGMCAVEAWTVARGWDFGDHPTEAPATIASFLRSWNDALPDDETRTRLLRPLVEELAAVEVWDTSAEAEERRAWLATDWLVRELAPAFLDLTDALRPHGGILRALAPVLSREAAARAAARDAARDAARAAAWDALRPTVEAMQISAQALVRRMAAVEGGR